MKAFTVDMDSLGGRNLNGVQLHGKTGVAVGQGGLVLTTEAGGSSWNFAELGLAKNVAYDWDFRAVHGAGKQYWVVGRPGSVVLHSGDDGAHWEVQRTNQPLPLDAVYFADEQHGWAVGELGSILATTDGGKSWQVQRRGGQRSAALFVHARAAGTPLDTIALVGGQDGYLTTSLRVTSPDPAGAAPARSADAVHAAWHGCASGGRHRGAEMLWQFPVPSHLAHANRDDLLQAWDSLHAGHAAEQMLRQLVLALRVWRPDVVVTDGPDAGATDFLVAEALREAVKAAADPKMFPEQISVMGLEPWKASKLYGRCDGHTEGPVSLDLTVVSGALQTTPREYAEVAAAYFGDEAAVIPGRRSYRLLAAAMPGAQDHHDLMQGVELAPGGLARRPLVATEASPALVKAIHQRAALQTLSEAPIAGLTDPEKLLSQIGPMLADMPDAMAGRAAFAVGAPSTPAKDNGTCTETFLMMVDRYPAHPRTPDAFRWLIRHNCSSEAAAQLNWMSSSSWSAKWNTASPKPRNRCSRYRPRKTKTMAIRARRRGRRNVPRCPASETPATGQHIGCGRQRRGDAQVVSGRARHGSPLNRVRPRVRGRPVGAVPAASRAAHPRRIRGAEEVVRRLREPPAARPVARCRRRGVVADQSRRHPAQARRLLPLCRGASVSRRQARRRLLEGRPGAGACASGRRCGRGIPSRRPAWSTITTSCIWPSVVCGRWAGASNRPNRGRTTPTCAATTA